MDSEPLESNRQTSDGSVPAAKQLAMPQYAVGPPVASTEIVLLHNFTPRPVRVRIIGDQDIDFEQLVLDHMPNFTKDRVPILAFPGEEELIQPIDVLNDITHEPGEVYHVHEGHKILMYEPHVTEPRIIFIPETRVEELTGRVFDYSKLSVNGFHVLVYDHESETELDLSNTNARLPKTITVVVEPISGDGWLFDSDGDDDLFTTNDLLQ